MASKAKARQGEPPETPRPRSKSNFAQTDLEALDRDQLLAEIENLRAGQMELEHSQQVYAELFDLSPIGYLNLTPSGSIETANLAAAELLYQPRHSLRSFPFRPFVTRDDRLKFDRHLDQCRASVGGDISTELQLILKNGETRFVELLSRPSVLFGTSRPVYRTVLHDLTGRRQAEALLRESERRLRALVEQTTAGVVWMDLDGAITFVNRQFTEMLGSGDQALTGQRWTDLVHADDIGAARRALRRLIARGTPFQLRERLRRKDGAFVWMHVNASAVLGVKGEPEYLVAIAIDVTERVQAEAALAANREQLRLIIENAREYAIFSMDLDRYVTSWNIGAERLLGYRGREILGRTGDTIFAPEDRAAGVPEQEALSAIREGRALDERWHIRKDGSRFWGSGVMMPMHDADRTVGLIKIFRDDTEARQAQEAQERSREELWAALQETERARADAEAAGKAKDHFLAVLSHELRTPLTPVLMAVHMLSRRTDLNPQVLAALAMIRRNILLEARLVDDLLDVTRIARGKMEVVRTPLDLHEAIHHAVEISRPDFEAKDQELTVALSAPAHQIEGDIARLQQVVWNLLKNASKFSPRGAKIRLRTSNAGEKLLIKVSDHGIGIEPDAIARIFDAFAQANERISREFGGLGLGLAISKAAVEAHGGELRVASRGLGHGAHIHGDASSLKGN